jgi:hypothetical protein
MNDEGLKKYLDEIEKLSYKSRLPEHATLFRNKAIMSKMLWDVHYYNAKRFYKESNQLLEQTSDLEQNGYITGKLNEKETSLLKDIFLSCKKKSLDPFDFSTDYFYEPRENLHGDMERVNNYFHPSEFFFNRFPEILEPLKTLIEKENFFYWRVASLRIFEVKPVDRTQGFHLDSQALGYKKMFFYPDGANKSIGSTNIIDKNGNDIIIDLEPGSWLIFENSLCEHQAYSSEEAKGRPTIEIDIMCDFITDTKLNYTGENSWYPWFPVFDSKLKTNGKFDYGELQNRNLKRLAGLCELNKANEYTFPWEMSDFYEKSKETFSLDDSAIKSSAKLVENDLKDYIFNFLRKIKKIINSTGKNLTNYIFNFLRKIKKTIKKIFIKLNII